MEFLHYLSGITYENDQHFRVIQMGGARGRVSGNFTVPSRAAGALNVFRFIPPLHLFRYTRPGSITGGAPLEHDGKNEEDRTQEDRHLLRRDRERDQRERLQCAGALSLPAQDGQDEPRQLVFCDPGVGTVTERATWHRWKANINLVLGLATGCGLDDNVLAVRTLAAAPTP